MKRSLLVNLGLSLAVTVLLLGALESAARLVEKRRPASAPAVADYIWDWDRKMPGGFYVMKSDAAGWPPWEEFNADGLRDRTRSQEKPDGVRRVVVLGDSVTLGAQIRADQAFPQLLEARLAAAGRPVEVMNVALWGWSTRQERIAWERIARRYHPDAAILAVCLNDIPELHNNLDRPPRWLTALHERSALVRVIVNAQRREIESVERLFEDPEARRVREALELFFAEVQALREEVQKDGASFSMIVFPFRFQVEPGAPDPSVQRRIAVFCGAEKVRCLDLLPVLAPLGRSAFADYDHLSASGAAATAEAIWRSQLLPPADAAPDLLRRAMGTARDGALVERWLAAGGEPLSPDGARALASALSAADAPTRVAAAWALARAGAGAAPARDALVAALRRDASTGVRVVSATALGALGTAARPVLPDLFAALDDGSEAVRHSVAAALSRLPLGRDDVAKLLTALENRDDYVAAFAAWTLGNMGDAARDAVPALARALAREKTDGVVSGALARIGPAASQAVPVLLEALRSPDADRRWRAARTLGRIGPAAEVAVAPLAQALSDENGAVRQHAARALGRLGKVALPAAAALQQATADPDKSVRREALAALERLR